MRVIYIAGTSHSGSTLLDLMLNAHPKVISVGEVLKLNRQMKPRNEMGGYAACSCGAPSLLQCPFWSAVNQRIEATERKPLAELDVLDQGEQNPARAPNVAMFRAVAEVSGKDFIVDSSKLPRRLSYLMQFDELDVYPVHIVRNPKGQIASVMRKHGGFLKNILRYELVHEQVRRRLAHVPHSVVRYEDLVRDPERTLQSVLAPLGLEFDARQRAWAEQEKHNVAGNHLRYQTKSELVLDETWKERLSPLRQRAIDIGTLLSRRLIPGTGYVSGEGTL